MTLRRPALRGLAWTLPVIAISAAAATLFAGRAGAQAPSASEKPKTAEQAGDAKAIDFEPIPAAEDRPRAPTAAEWQSAALVRFTARGPRAKSCKLFRVREWLKVRCERQTTAVGLMGGASDGALLWLPPAKDKEPAPAAAEVTFPMKVGDRRVFELFSYGPAYGGSMISPGLVLQEHWVAGEPAPVVIVR